MRNIIAKPGTVYGEYTIIKEAEPKRYGKDKRPNRMVSAKCSCGIIKTTRLSDLKRGVVKSCGCLKNRYTHTYTHGMSDTRIYRIWKYIKGRCENTNNTNYHNYGGRGIRVEWRSFEEFYSDMKEGYSDELTIDRIDVNGNYCKDNCRWATNSEQARNKRNNRVYKGKCVSDWSKELGLNRKIVYNRINNYGWTIEEALGFKQRNNGKK